MTQNPNLRECSWCGHAWGEHRLNDSVTPVRWECGLCPCMNFDKGPDMNSRQKRVIVKKIRAEMHGWYDKQPADRAHIGSYCLWWAFFTCLVLRREIGIPAQLQAGSAYWPRLTPEQDDGSDATMPQFGYQYTPGPQNVRMLLSGVFPETHVWAADATTHTIFDLTTMYWPVQAKLRANLDWPGKQPPSYFWGQSQDLPAGADYSPDIEAIALCYNYLELIQQGETVIESGTGQKIKILNPGG